MCVFFRNGHPVTVADVSQCGLQNEVGADAKEVTDSSVPVHELLRLLRVDSDAFWHSLKEQSN